MRIGIDDTDSPVGMCTTYLGAYLIQKLEMEGILVRDASLIRLNPNVRYKTRGNAAVCIEADGDPDHAFSIACRVIEKLADFSHENTHPGLVVVGEPPGTGFYEQALRHFCTIGEARSVLDAAGAHYKGWKIGRGLIGATAAVCAEFSDETYELLAYRSPVRKNGRMVDRESVFRAENATFPHTWDSVDSTNNVVVCVPHTPDPVLFGIRGESPAWVRQARSHVISEAPACEQVYRTNQGTDAHLLPGTIGHLLGGRSYIVRGRVAAEPVTGRGGHVTIHLEEAGSSLRCMAYEPTKGFRNTIRQLIPQDRILAVGSFIGGSINLEKICVEELADSYTRQPPMCRECETRMTSAGTNKGFKCRKCGAREENPDISKIRRVLKTGWYEVPPSARRHLAKPLVRGTPVL
jgi:tRNA(Ile2)-agmatinylcytidine synthase